MAEATTDKVTTPLEAPGKLVDNVEITIDQAIIQHFSQHLYSSPHKAIEELVVNGYDAGANEVRVWLPGEFADHAVVVWDDGNSMDQQGLHQLWWVARSPKNAEGARKLGARDLIGKFGIGKLAAYALGSRIAHLAHTGGRYLLVEFDFADLSLPEDGEPPPSEPEQQNLTAPMRELDEQEARKWARSLFTGDEMPEASKRLFASEKWTVAVVGDLKEDPDLKSGILRRVLGNGLPNRPDFKMHVNDKEAEQVLTMKQPAKDLHAGEAPLRQQLLNDWEEAAREGVVAAGLRADDHGLLSVPGLGAVRIELRAYSQSLLEESSAALGRSYGVFVMVRGRLLNEEDYQHLVQEPSFGTLYRVQIVVHADGLDRALLADRERLAGSRPETMALRVLEQAAYRAARQLVDKEQAEAALEKLAGALMPTNHRELWHDPIAAYSAARGQPQRLPLDDPEQMVKREADGEDAPMAQYDAEAGQFTVNTAHPFRKSVDAKIGQGKKAVQLRRVLDVYAVAEVLLEGHLIDAGFDRDKVAQVLDWRNDLFREVARRFHEAPDELQARVREASYEGDRAFEFALRDIFVDMGFDAARVAGPGKEDVLVVAPVGTDHHLFTVEAKGSKNDVRNVTAHVAGVAAHRDAVDDAEHALIIARDFTGFGNGDQAALLKECRAVKGVSAVTLDVLFALHDLMHTFWYPLRVVLDLLRPVRTPEEFLEDLESFQRPRPAFDYPALLHQVWDRQRTSARGEPVYYQPLRQERPDWKAAIAPNEMDRQMLMLEWASGALVRVDSDRKTVTMRQKPEIVLDAVEATLRGEGYVHESGEPAGEEG